MANRVPAEPKNIVESGSRFPHERIELQESIYQFLSTLSTISFRFFRRLVLMSACCLAVKVCEV
jgi:hypothetical protein